MNDCVFRHRNVYEFIVMPDQDEFLSFPTIDTQQPDIRQVFRGIFKDDNSAAALYFSAMYHVHCYMAEVCLRLPHIQAVLVLQWKWHKPTCSLWHLLSRHPHWDHTI